MITRKTFDFSIDNPNEIFEYWKRKWGKKRFERLSKEQSDNTKIKEKFFMNIFEYGDSEEEILRFIKDYK